MTDADLSGVRVVVVAANASKRVGGEAILPVHYFRLLRQRGVDVHLVCHERNRAELAAEFPDAVERIHLAQDRAASRLIERLGRRVPRNVKAMTIWVLMAVINAFDLRRIVRGLVHSAPGAAVVHEPVPVSPRQPSFMHDVGAPVVVGPLNGGMTYPPGFTEGVGTTERVVRWLIRRVSDLANMLIDGKGRAAVVFVANPRTHRALPRSARSGRIVELVENGVDLTTFTRRVEPPTGAPRFAFLGRLVDWKRVDLLLAALARVPEHYRLEIIGSGPVESDLRSQAVSLGLADRVTFHGLLPQEAAADVLAECDALVLPSIYECGGAVVLEAMAVGLPVIATDWGGPADYVVHDETGFLVAPDSPEALAAGFAAAMLRLGEDAVLAQQMGAAGRDRVEAHFDWNHKIELVCSVYTDLAGRRPGMSSTA